MPNWCNNTVEISHNDPAKLEALAAAVREGSFLKHVIPVPESLNIIAGRAGADDNPEQIALVEAENRNLEQYGYANWYDYCVAKWGTKWDVDAYTGEDTKVENNQLTFGFDSAWSPPIGVYEALVEQGFSVRAYYYEPGMAYAGIWEDGEDDYYELGDMSSEQVRETLPESLDECMGISETMAEYEDMENEE